MEPAHMKRFE